MPAQQQRQSKAEVLVGLLMMLMVVGVNTYSVWITLPPQQRMWIRLAVAGRVRSAAARMAWMQGHHGMQEELRTGQRSVRYLAAWGLSTVRDRANSALEAMRP